MIKNMLTLLTPVQRRSAVVLLVLMLFGMLLETLGIGLVIPTIALMVQDDFASRYPVMQPLLVALGNPSHKQLVVVGMMTLVGVYTIKSLFLAFLAWQQSRFVYGLQASLSQRLFEGYLRQPYTFHLQRNSAQLINNVFTETKQFANSGMVSMTLLLTELFVLFGISVLLLVVEPLGALIVVSTLGLAGWVFSRITRKHILKWGKARQLHEGLRIQHIQQGLGGAKDVKLLGRESDFIAQYAIHTNGSIRVSRLEYTLLQLPRLWLELLAIIGLAVLVLIMIGQGKPMEALLPTLGLFAAAAFRLMPSVTRLLNAIQGIRYSLPAMTNLHNEFLHLEDDKIRKSNLLLPFKHTLQLEDVSFRYPSSEVPALSQISLTIPQGASVGFIGGSGAGKSTLVDIILGLLTPDAGTIKVDDIDIQTNLRAWQDQIGYVPQTIYLTDDTLRRNIAFGLSHEQIDDAVVWRAIEAAQLNQFVMDLPQGLDSMVGERGIRLSGGQRQRIGIARALYHDPSVLVLDEATSSLDIDTEQDVMKAVNALRGNKTVLIVAHRLSTVEQCDYIYRLENCKIVEEGYPAIILGTNKNDKAG